MQFDLHEIWAKTDPYQSILTHSTLSGIVAQVIARHMIAPGTLHRLSDALSCSTEKAINWIGYLVSLHDIGKIEGQFQYRWTAMREKMDQQGLKPDFPILNPFVMKKPPVDVCESVFGGKFQTAAW